MSSGVRPLSFKIDQRLSQKLKLSPQMIQSIGLLSLSITELGQAVRQELTENPVLEERGEVAESISPAEAGENEKLDWTEYTSSHLYSQRDSTDIKNQSYERHTPVEESLKDHLIWQIHFSDHTEEEKAILFLIIQEINDDGYLTETIENIARENKLDIKIVQTLLSYIQELDPSGVGARDLKESLLIQLKRAKEDTKDMVLLVNNHLEDLKNKDYKKIAQSLNLEQVEIKDMVDIISSMNPFPGQSFHSSNIQYITPDIYIYKTEDGNYETQVNEEGMPQIRIASHYAEFLSQMELDPHKLVAKKYLVEKMKRALGFIRALNQRRKNILKLASVIAEEQKEFFEHGERFLRPLLLKEVSSKVGVHISTISRLTTNKFVHTPQGVFELKYFFGISYTDKEGNRLSADTIKTKIQKWIEEEVEPLSDDKISKILFTSDGIRLSRRQVKRLREEIGIPNTIGRKKNL